MKRSQPEKQGVRRGGCSGPGERPVGEEVGGTRVSSMGGAWRVSRPTVEGDLGAKRPGLCSPITGKTLNSRTRRCCNQIGILKCLFWQFGLEEKSWQGLQLPERKMWPFVKNAVEREM